MKLLVSTALVQKVLKKDILNYVTELIGISYLGSFGRFFFKSFVSLEVTQLSGVRTLKLGSRNNNNNNNNNTKIPIAPYPRALKRFTIKCLKQ